MIQVSSSSGSKTAARPLGLHHKGLIYCSTAVFVVARIHGELCVYLTLVKYGFLSVNTINFISWALKAPPLIGQTLPLGLSQRKNLNEKANPLSCFKTVYIFFTYQYGKIFGGGVALAHFDYWAGCNHHPSPSVNYAYEFVYSLLTKL